MIESRTRGLGRALCFFGASLGALGMLAWLFQVERVLTVVPGLPPMMPNSATALLLLGVAAALVLQVQPRRMRRLLATLAAIVVLAISLGTVAEYALDTHLFLDQLVRDRVGPYYPSPSSPPAAIALALLAAGILFFDWGSGKRFQPSEWLILAAAIIAVTALLGYLYGATPTYRLTGPPVAGVTPTSMRLIRVAGDLLIIGVSLPTAVSLFLISMGLFLGRPDVETMRIVTGPSQGGLLLRRMMPVAILVPIGFGLIASRLPGTDPLVLAALTGATTVLTLFLLGISAVRLDRVHDVLEQTRRQTRELIDLASEGIFISDREGRLTDVNDVGCRMAGYSREEILRKTIADLIPPHDLERLQAHRAQLLEGKIDVGEWALRRKDGSYSPVEVSASIFPDGRWLAFSRDISERKRLQDEQRLLSDVGSVLASTLEFEDTLSNIAQLVVANLADLCIINFIDDDGVARRARVFCRDPAKAWISDALMRMPPGRAEVRIAQSVLETRKPALIAEVTPDLVRFWAASDEQLVALQSISPRSAVVVPLVVHGHLLGALSLISSDSSRTYGPEDLRVAEAIAGRSAFFLENARLYRTAKRATQTRDDVMGIVAHDLRNPLQIIVANAALLHRRGPEPARQRGVEIENAANRMNRLIQDLLDVTRMEAGHLPLKPARIHTAEIIADSLEVQTPLASSASLELRAASAPDLPDIWADHDRLLQVFENLIGNAIKFTKPGGQITLGAEASAEGVVFSVSDTGAGIAESELPHVFDRFWQAPDVTHRGAGLGLPIVKGIVEAHGGRVWVKSSISEGSTFFFTIPTAAKASSAPQPSNG